ncbi:hypothetical protein [Bradyrhizobium sp.]|uniref:hypothetical protein n=1 Tax=Bradyrhizobium sp. TaxID=376 RepID=UPI003C1D8488
MNRSAIPKTAMTLASIAILAASLTAIAGTAEARARWHHYDNGPVVYGDCSVSGMQSPAPLIYPAADWGPFLHRVRHYGPVLYLPPGSCEAAPAETALGPAIRALD